MSTIANEVQTKMMTHEEISRLGGVRSAQSMGRRKLKQRAKKASDAAQRARADCKHPEDRVIDGKCRFCGRRLS